MITLITAWLKKHHWIHSWGKWYEKVYEMTVYTLGGKQSSSNKSFQDRECSVCGKRESEPL